MDTDAGSLQQHQQAAAVANDTPIDTPQARAGDAVSMATDVDVAAAASQPKCPNLRGILRVAENRRVLMSVIPTLTLAIMGG